MTKSRILALVLGCGFATSAHAGRTVSIAIQSNTMELSLTNPSTVSVPYSVSCFTAAGAAIGSATSGTLAPNATAKVPAGQPDMGKCAGNAAPQSSFSDKNGKKVYVCEGSVAESSAGTLCGVGQRYCFPESRYASCASGDFYGYSVWLKNDSLYYMSGCSYVSVPSNEVVYADGNNCSGITIGREQAYSGYYYLFHQTTSPGPRGAVCCEDPVAAGLCKVTINSQDSSAFLSSPHFKGGASF